MRYLEIIKESSPRIADDQESASFYDPNQDAFNGQTLGDTRKPALTLKMINRLKKIRSTKNLEMIKKQELLGIMYGVGAGEDDEI